MKNKRKGYIFRVRQFLLLCLMFLMILCDCVPVYATEDGSEGTSAKDPSDRVIVGQVVDDDVPEDYSANAIRAYIIDKATKSGMISADWTTEQTVAFAQCAADIVIALKAKGLSDSAAAGIMLNMYAESNFDPYMIQGELSRRFINFEYKTNGAVGLKTYDENMKELTEKEALDSTKVYSSRYTDDLNKHPGLGLIQFSEGRRADLVEYGRTLSGSDRCVIKLDVEWSYNYKNPDGNLSSAKAVEINVPNATMQVAYILENPNEGENQWNSGRANLAKYDLPDMSWSEFLSCDEPVETCTKMFAVAYERPSDMDKIVYENARSGHDQLMFAKSLFKVGESLGKISTVGNMLADERETSMSRLATSGFWSENELSAYCKLAEINVEEEWLAEARRTYLRSKDLYELAAWELNVKTNTIESFLVNGGRRIVVFAGILFEVWSILIYLAYWFDRINNFIEIDLLSILTFGRLRIADDTTKATYSLRHNERNKVKTVNHRAIVCIVIIGLTIGTLIISGRVFSLLYWLFTRVNKWLH